MLCQTIFTDFSRYFLPNSMPDAGIEPGAIISTGHPVSPSRNRSAPTQHRHHHPLVHAVPAGSKAFQPVDGRQIALRVGEGHQFPMDKIPVAGWVAEAWCADLLLPAGVGQWIGGAPGQDQPFRHLERREPGVEMVGPRDSPPTAYSRRT